MPELGDADERKEPKFKLEYLTYTLPSLQLGNGGDEESGERMERMMDADYKKGKKGIWHPVPLKELPEPLLKRKKKSKKYFPYEMEDLTIGSWMRMAVRLGRESKLRKRFKEYMYMGGEEQ